MGVVQWGGKAVRSLAVMRGGSVSGDSGNCAYAVHRSYFCISARKLVM
jgi:hypothetical protein